MLIVVDIDDYAIHKFCIHVQYMLGILSEIGSGVRPMGGGGGGGDPPLRLWLISWPVWLNAGQI
jgi:hypothetical protein